MVRKETHEFFEHALVQCSFGLPTPVEFLRMEYESPTSGQPCTRTPTWLFASKQFQCSSHCLRQFSLILVILTVPFSIGQNNRGILTERTSFEHTG